MSAAIQKPKLVAVGLAFSGSLAILKSRYGEKAKTQQESFVMGGPESCSQAGLPPREVRLVNHRKEKIPTPLDDRGLVDVPRLINEVKHTVDPEYEWLSSAEDTNRHHFYWPRRNFVKPLETDEQLALKRFRELPINQGLVPVTFHNWLHAVTEPPVSYPDPEVVDYRIESWEVVRRLFNSVSYTNKWQRLARRQAIIREEGIIPTEEHLIDQEVIDEVLEKNFQELERSLNGLHKLPPEFRLVDPDQPLHRISKEVGRLAAPRAPVLIRAVTGQSAG